MLRQSNVELYYEQTTGQLCSIGWYTFWANIIFTRNLFVGVCSLIEDINERMNNYYSLDCSTIPTNFTSHNDQRPRLDPCMWRPKTCLTPELRRTQTQPHSRYQRLEFWSRHLTPPPLFFSGNLAFHVCTSVRRESVGWLSTGNRCRSEGLCSLGYSDRPMAECASRGSLLFGVQ